MKVRCAVPTAVTCSCGCHGGAERCCCTCEDGLDAYVRYMQELSCYGEPAVPAEPPPAPPEQPPLRDEELGL